MTNDSRRYLDPEVASRVSSLELRARQIVEGLMSGRHRSALKGQSVEFAQHREYTPGDDLRHLDWKVWAKQDRLYIKEFVEETNLRATILLDASASMDYGSGEEHKHTYASLLAAAVSYLLLRQSDSVGLVTFDQQIRAEVPHRNPTTHLQTILHALHVESPQKKTDLEAIMRQVSESQSRPGMIVLISDLLAERESVLKSLRLLRQRRHDVILFHLLHDDEMTFTFKGMTRFVGLEETAQLTCDPRALRADYLQSLERYLGELRRLAGQTGVDYRLTRTSEPIDAVLARLLHERIRT